MCAICVQRCLGLYQPAQLNFPPLFARLPLPLPLMQAEQPSSSALRGSSSKAGEVQAAATSELMVSKQEASAWQRQWDDMRNKVCT